MPVDKRYPVSVLRAFFYLKRGYMEFKQNTLERQQTKLVIEKAKEHVEGQFEAVLSTDDLDRHGERVSIKGIVIPKDQVIKMYYNHQTYGDALPIGKWLRIWKKNGVLMGLGQIDIDDSFAYKIYRKIQGGFIDSISIGFYPEEFDGETSTWTKSKLVEASVVAEPANVGAKITSKELGFSQEEFDKELEQKMTDNSSKDGATDTDWKAALEDVSSRLGALEAAGKAANENPAKKSIERVRVALKQVDQSVEKANRIIKVKLKES